GVAADIEILVYDGYIVAVLLLPSTLGTTSTNQDGFTTGGRFARDLVEYFGATASVVEGLSVATVAGWATITAPTTTLPGDIEIIGGTTQSHNALVNAIILAARAANA
ncbi:MAG: hypothetical protein FWB72_07495, partial [Firmicutes bacterium]|nr:hypothetical protein [Bacillota bacterium]